MYSIGPSSYPDLRGVDQVIATDRMAQQFWSTKVDFDKWMSDRGRTGRLSANEGYRPKERCLYLWDNRTALGIVVAPPLTSRHYQFPNAIDFGVTEPTGMNRALAPDEFTELHRLVELRGGTWTGVNFGEPWHHEMATRTEVLPPYPNARAIAESGPTPTVSTSQQEELLMHMFQVQGGGIFLAGPQFLTHYDDGAAAARDAKRFGKTIETVTLAEGQRILGVFHVPWNYADAKQFRKAAPTGQWDARGPVKAV